MSSLTVPATGRQPVFVGVDTHQRTHHAVVVDADGRRLDGRQFPASRRGYEALLAWMVGVGQVMMVGVESTGSYGANLTRILIAAGVEVIEVNRPDLATRATQGKSDPIDAEAAAHAVRTGRARVLPKATDGVVASIRALKNTRDAFVATRSRFFSQLRDMITTAPDELRDQLLPLTSQKRVAVAAALRPDLSRLTDPVQATKWSLRSLAQQIQALDEQVATIDRSLDGLVADVVPTLIAKPQFGTQTAAQLLITAGHNIGRLRTEAQFARLTGAAPIPASSGKSTRMRLSRGGDRQANKALYMIAIGRLRSHEPTKAYVARREADGHNRRDIIRSLKRYIAREAFTALKRDLASFDRP